MIESLENRTSSIAPRETRYMDHENNDAHYPSLEGIPVGANLVARPALEAKTGRSNKLTRLFAGVAEALASAVKGFVEVKIYPQDGTQITIGSDVRELPKEAFLSLPLNRRHVDFPPDSEDVDYAALKNLSNHLAPLRAQQINLAIQSALHAEDESHLAKNPFRKSDTLEIAELVAIASDHKFGHAFHAESSSWHSAHHHPEAANRVYEVGELHAAHKGGVEADVDQFVELGDVHYRSQIQKAVARLMAPRKSKIVDIPDEGPY